MMTGPRLPGVPTIAALMVVAILAAAISVTGPFPAKYDAIRDFQPLIAAVAVIFGGTLAYLAAMARVRLDRELHESQRASHQRNLLLKVRFAGLIFFEEVRTIRKKVVPETGGKTGNFSSADFLLAIPKEFDEAWDNLDLFSDEGSHALVNVKYNCKYLRNAVERLDQMKTWQYRWTSSTPPDVEDAITTIKDLENYTAKLLQALPQSNR